ncbi:MAG: carboxypeptidase regulatory-like domain-containing protein [Planctomycetes bacterium]|nr:carboxypeptidase regulatory-like domain-containing protein [Planctomycetota bacterium]
MARLLLAMARLLLAMALLGASPALGQDAYAGKVVDPKGKPVAGVVLELRDAYQESVRAKATVRTNSQGKFSISKDWLSKNLPEWVKSISVIARDPSGRFAPGKDGLSRLYAGDFEGDETIRLSEGVKVELQVVDEAGDPLAGARVHALDRGGWVGRSAHDPLTADAAGRVRFGVTKLPQTYVASVPGRQVARLTVAKGSGGKGTLILRPGLTQSGRVLDSQGKPLANAVVAINRGTDTGGLISAERWLEGRLCQDAYRAHHKDDPYAQDPGGRPRDDYFGTELVLAITDAEGKFVLKGLDGTKRKLMALHQTHSTQVLEITPGKDLEIRLLLGITISGVAQRPDRSASIGAVEAASAMGPAYRIAKVQPDGTYLLEGLTNRTYAVRVSDNDDAATAFVSVNGTPLSDCVLGGGTAVTGAVSGIPSEGFMRVILLLVSTDGKSPHAYETSAGGSGRPYRFGGVRPGTYKVMLFEEKSNPDNLLGEIKVKEGQLKASFGVKIPARYVAGEKERRKKNLERMGIDPSILDDIEKSKAEAKARADAPKEPEADRELAKQLDDLLEGSTDLDAKDLLSIHYLSIKPETLGDFRWKGLSAAPGEYGAGIAISAKPRSLGRLEHLIGFKGDFKISFDLELLGGSKRSLCAITLNKNIAVAWGQQICKAKNLKPYRGKPRGMGILTADSPLEEVVIQVKGSTLTVSIGGSVVDQRTFKKGELEDLTFGIVLRDAKVSLSGLTFEGTVDRDRLPKAKKKRGKKKR